MPKFFLLSLGCDKNLVDSEVMLGSLVKDDHSLALTPQEADIIIVNTCAFIGPAKKESIDTILELAEYKKSGNAKVLVVAGCLAQRYHEELKNEIPEIDLFVGTGEYAEIVSVINNNFRERKLSRPEFAYTEFTPRINTQPKHRAYLKVAEGCSTGCAFCIIPKLRGGAKSRAIQDVVNEAKTLVSHGVQELLVVAQNLTSYGFDRDKTYWLASLLRELNQLDCKWIRLHYCYPDNFSDELIRIVSDSEKICHYIDIPFQHVNDEVLQRMNRRGTTKSHILTLIDKLRAFIPDVSIRSSFITGFPGETESQFEELKEFIISAKLDHVGVFPYSDEEGVLSEKSDGHLPEEIRIQRAEELMKIQQAISRDNLRKYIGTELEIVVEEEQQTDGKKLFIGRSQFQAPEVDGTVIIDQGSAQTGTFAKVKIEETLDYDLIGSVIPPLRAHVIPAPRFRGVQAPAGISPSSLRA